MTHPSRAASAGLQGHRNHSQPSYLSSAACSRRAFRTTTHRCANLRITSSLGMRALKSRGCVAACRVRRDHWKGMDAAQLAHVHAGRAAQVVAGRDAAQALAAREAERERAARLVAAALAGEQAQVRGAEGAGRTYVGWETETRRRPHPALSACACERLGA